MKKQAKLLFVLLLGIIILCTLAACNQIPDKSTLPPTIGGTVISGNSPKYTAGLKFSFPVEPSSVFSSIYVGDFKLDKYVQYSVVYYDQTGAVVREIPRGGVTSNMIDEEDVPKLSTPGHHNIRVTETLDDNSTVTGSFALHLKSNSGKVDISTYTFKLGSSRVKTYFGNNDSVNNQVVVNLEKGVVIEDWTAFLDAFKMRLEGKAILSMTADGETYSATSSNFPLTIGANKTFTVNWTNNTVKVTYDLRVPREARVNTQVAGTENDPENLFGNGGKYYGIYVTKGSGVVAGAAHPLDEEVNVYDGYYFAGWYDKSTGKLYRFGESVGENDVNLYAKWVAAEYSFTLYTMGASFRENISPATHNGTVITAQNAQSLGYTLVSSTSKFGLSDNRLSRITVTGFNYGIDYDKYVTEMQVNANGDRVMIKFADLYRPIERGANLFVKGGDYTKIENIYANYQCDEPLERLTKVSTEQPVAYIKWVFNAPEVGSANYDEVYLDKISAYYTQLVYKNGYTIKADGSIRLDKINDYSLNELVVPATIKVAGVERPLTEFGKNACANVRALTLIDLSKACNLTTLGEQAFAHDSSLSQIIMPEDSHITQIGDGAFMGTDYEENYYENNHGAEFIVINHMIYKYVGKKENKTEINLYASDYYTPAEYPEMARQPIYNCDYFNAQLAGVRSIESGAFENCKTLQTLILSDNIEKISDYAFVGVEGFKNLMFTSNTKLVDIGSSAFDDSGFLAKDANLYSPQYGAMFIGNIYYRLLDTERTTVTIPETIVGFDIKYIAPLAFDKCNLVENIIFEKEENIEKVGRDALKDTAFAKNQDFTSVNHILAEYYGVIYDERYLNLIVPDDVHSIADRAFGENAHYFKTLQIGANVTNIEDNAFSGANILESIIFASVDVEKDGENPVKLVNAPSIREYTFANSKGEMFSAKLYFTKKVMEYLDELERGVVTSTDEITNSWLNLYSLHKDSFVAEDIKSVVIDEKLVSHKLLKKTLTNNCFLDNYGTAVIDDALIITSNTGVKRREGLSWDYNTISLDPITQNGQYSNYFEAGLVKYVLHYTLGGDDTGCSESVFVITEYNAIGGVPAFTTSANPLVMNGKDYSTDNYWLEEKNPKTGEWIVNKGVTGQVEGATYPTYYTSTQNVEFRFAYKDIEGNVKTLAPRMASFTTGNIVSGAKAVLTVDFYGLGTYTLNLNYSIVRSRYNAIEQTSAINVPINASSNYLANYSVNIVGEDGNIVRLPLSVANFAVIEVNGVISDKINTTTMGMHTAKIRYTGIDTTKTLDYVINYTVVLTADESIFTYEVYNEAKKTARITSCNARNAVTIVVPSVCTIGDKQYTISQIGYVRDSAKGVFENFTNLKSVYLPETITDIGVHSFSGCTLLEDVFTAKQAVASYINVPATSTYFEVIADEYHETDEEGNDWIVKPAKLLTLEGLEYGSEHDDHYDLVLNADYVQTQPDGENAGVKFRMVSIDNTLRLKYLAAKVNVYLPDTIYHRVQMFGSANNTVSEIYFYASGSNFMFKAEDYAPSSLEYIGSAAFLNCKSLKTIDLSVTGESLDKIGSQAFMGCSSLIRMDFSHNTYFNDINSQMFMDCIALQEVKIGGSLESIGVSAFDNCLRLEKVYGYDYHLKFIGDRAFNRCESLVAIELESPNMTVGRNAFTNCGALVIYCNFLESDIPSTWNAVWNGSGRPVVWDYQHNNVASDGYVYQVVGRITYALDVVSREAKVVGQRYSIDGEVYIYPSITVTTGAASVQGNYVVTEIVSGAFEGNIGLTKVRATNALKVIGANAFAGCTGLTDFLFQRYDEASETFVNDSNGLETVSTTAFEGCDSLAIKPTPSWM